VDTGATCRSYDGLAVGAGASLADRADAVELTPLVATPTTKVRPVTSADGLEHLAYEEVVTNLYAGELTIESVSVTNPRTDEVLAELDSTDLADLTVRFGGGGLGNTFDAGAGGFILFDVILDPADALPKRLVHEFTVSVDPEPTPPETVTTEFRSGKAVVMQNEVRQKPPLRGDRWIVGEGCCDSVTAHRGALLPVNGQLRAPERFAIDFVQLDEDGFLFVDGGDENEDFGYYGRNVRSSTYGVVVATHDDVPDNPPGSFPPAIHPDDAGGNYVVVDIGDGQFAFYAHLIPNSLRVEVGDSVAPGDVLGELGNSGNSDAPHLHFHIMSTHVPLASNGLPHVFNKFTSEGTLTNLAAVATGSAADIDPVLTGEHRRELPLNLQVISFDP
jgi:Peptidase family M23